MASKASGRRGRLLTWLSSDRGYRVVLLALTLLSFLMMAGIAYTGRTGLAGDVLGYLSRTLFAVLCLILFARAGNSDRGRRDREDH